MSEMRLFAVAIDTVRDIFGANDQLAGRLRTVVSEQFTAPLMAARPKRSLLGRIGPMTRRPIDPPQIPLDRPLGYDADTLLAGRYVAPERIEQSWQIMIAWLHELAAGELGVGVSCEQVAKLEFALAFAGLPSEAALGTLFSLDPQIPLRPAPGMTIGYSKHAHVRWAAGAWRAAAGRVDEKHRATVMALTGFLSDFGVWGNTAQQAGGRSPDLLVVWRR